MPSIAPYRLHAIASRWVVNASPLLLRINDKPFVREASHGGNINFSFAEHRGKQRFAVEQDRAPLYTDQPAWLRAEPDMRQWAPQNAKARAAIQ